LTGLAPKALSTSAGVIAMDRAMSACEYDRPVGTQLGFAIMLPVRPMHGEGPPAILVSGVGSWVVAQPQIDKTASKAAHARMVMCVGSAWFDNNTMVRAFALDTNAPPLMRCSLSTYAQAREVRPGSRGTQISPA
jgi:hypothetical protein